MGTTAEVTVDPVDEVSAESCSYRVPQSKQSVPSLHNEYWAPGPPSSQRLSKASEHEFVHKAVPMVESPPLPGGLGLGGGGGIIQ